MLGLAGEKVLDVDGGGWLMGCVEHTGFSNVLLHDCHLCLLTGHPCKLGACPLWRLRDRTATSSFQRAGSWVLRKRLFVGHKAGMKLGEGLHTFEKGRKN
jgi:hypothetical protein